MSCFPTSTDSSQVLFYSYTNSPFVLLKRTRFRNEKLISFFNDQTEKTERIRFVHVFVNITSYMLKKYFFIVIIDSSAGDNMETKRLSADFNRHHPYYRTQNRFLNIIFIHVICMQIVLQSKVICCKYSHD